MGGEIQKAKDLLFGMAYTEGDYDQMIELVEKLVSRAEAAETDAKRLKEALTKIAEDPIIGMYQMREIAKKSLKGGE